VSTDLEHALRRALDATDGVVRGSDRDLAAGAMRGHRRRHIVRAGVAGAAVLAVAIAVSALILGRPGDADQRTGTTPTASPDLILDPATARPIEEVWPQAIRTLPGRLPNGQDYNVIEEIRPGMLVVQVKTGFERYGSVYRYQPGLELMVELIDARALNPTTSRIANVGEAVVLDGMFVALQTLEGEGEPSLLEVVSVGDGSRLARVELPPGAEIDLVAWTGEQVVWTDRGGDGIHSAADPLSVMPGTNGFHLTGQGAWAVSDESATMIWWNLETGDRHEEPAGADPMPCYGRTCVTDPSHGQPMRIVGVDGPGGTAAFVGGDIGTSPWGDHFMVVEYNHGLPDATRLLWNLRSNSYAKLPLLRDPMDAAGTDTDILVLSMDSEHKVVVNLTAI
jgi:hypothetical protein